MSSASTAALSRPYRYPNAGSRARLGDNVLSCVPSCGMKFRLGLGILRLTTFSEVGRVNAVSDGGSGRVEPAKTC